jgi:hypothetical protein
MAFESALTRLGTGGEVFLDRMWRFWWPDMAAEAARNPPLGVAIPVDPKDFTQDDWGAIAYAQSLPPEKCYQLTPATTTT